MCYYTLVDFTRNSPAFHDDVVLEERMSLERERSGLSNAPFFFSTIKWLVKSGLSLRVENRILVPLGQGLEGSSGRIRSSVALTN